MGDDTAVSPVIGTLLILATFSVVVTTVIMVGRPQIVEYQEQGEFQSVVNQVAQVATDASQLAISGNANEIRHPTLSLPRGDLVVERGHHMAVSIGYFDSNYTEVQGHDADPGNHPDFYVRAADLTGVGGPDFGPDWDATDQAIEVVYLDDDHAGSGRQMYGRLAQWNGADWVSTYTTTPTAVKSGQPLPYFPLLDANSALVTLTDGPWRIRVYTDPLLGSDTLIGEILIYDLTRLKYHYSGESGPRTAYIENGAVLVTEHNQHRVARAGIVAAPAGGFGGSTLTIRAAVLDQNAGSASGRTEVGFLMRVADVEDWIRHGGAAIARVQMSGPYPTLWYDHLDDQGFTPDADPARGVTYADERTTQGRHTAFPANVIHTEIDLRFRQR